MKKRIFLKKIIYFLNFFLALLIFNLIFIYLYHTNLGLGISTKTFLFLFLFTLEFAFSVYLCRNIIFRIILFLLFFLFTIYALINFAYYEVFQNFFDISFGQIKQIKKPLIELLSDYHFLIPKYIYYLTGVLFFSLVLTSYYYLKNYKKFKLEIKKFYKEIKEKKVSPIFFIILLIFICLNFFFYFTIHSYKNNLDKNNFSRLKYFSDMSIYGYLFDQASEKFGQQNQKTYTKLSGIEKIKKNLKNLENLKKNKESKNNNIRLKRNLDKPHIIIYQMESVSSWPLAQDPSPMPHLEELMEKYITVDKFFANSCITINAEFSSMCSFYPETSGPISDLYAHNNYYCLPEILNNYGYETSIFHANNEEFWNRNILNEKWSYKNKYFVPEYINRASDEKVIQDVITRIKDSDKPSFNYIVGFTSHSPHNKHFIEFNKINNDLEIAPYEKDLNEISKSTDRDEETIRNYLGFLGAIDEAIKTLFEELKVNNLMDKTIVIIYADHKYYNTELEDKVREFYYTNEIPFLLYVPGGYQGEAKAIASHIDIAPTILDLIEYNRLPKNFLGQSIFSNEHSESVINKCLGSTFYVDENIVFKYNNLLDITQVVTYLDKYAKFKLDDYSENLKEIVKTSDKIIIQNKLGSKDEIEITTSTSTKINFNQATDSDHDGLSDMREKVIGTDRYNPDTDGDGFLDGVEVIHGYDPLQKAFVN